MNVHKNAKTTARSRALIIERHQRQWSAGAIAQSLGISRRTVCKWLARWRSEGASGLADRSSRPPPAFVVSASAATNAVLHLRRTFLMPAYGIAAQLGLAYSTVCRLLKRARISRGKSSATVNTPSMMSCSIFPLCGTRTSSNRSPAIMLLVQTKRSIPANI